MIKPAKAYQLVCDYLGEKKETEEVVRLHTEKWYKILRETGQPPYEIYGERDYLFDMVDCFKNYSYSYIREISGYLKESGVNKIIDYGAGIGFTTANIRDFLPKAHRVTYCNLRGSQWDFAESFFKHYPEPIEMLDEEDVLGAGGVDCLIAFEFFEHFHKPAEHLEKMLKAHSPKSIIHSTSFSIDSVGHFDSYEISGRNLSKRSAMAAFKKSLREFGYKQKETGFWCDRPQIWERENA